MTPSNHISIKLIAARYRTGEKKYVTTSRFGGDGSGAAMQNNLFQIGGIINTESLPDVFANRSEQKNIRVFFIIIISLAYSYCYSLTIGLCWATIYLFLNFIEGLISKRPTFTSSPFSLFFLSINMIGFGWVALASPEAPETSCLFLFAALLNTIVTSRRCTSAFLAGAIPIIIMLAAVQIQASMNGVPLRRLIMVGLAILITGGFCAAVWHGYSKSLSQAMEAAKAKSAFLANMSHELRTPLNGVVAMASALQRTELSDQQRSMLGIISVSAESLQILLSDILDLAKIEAGKIDLQSEPLAPAALARHVAALFTEPCSQKGLTFEVGWDALSEQLVLGDSVRLTQILTNFCSNAVKFTAAGGVKLSVVSVRTAHTMTIRFDVVDSGIGMSPDAKARIFERFSQGDGSITRRFGGTGLGLAISKQLADLMGGRILVESGEGMGSTFSVLLELPVAGALNQPLGPVSKAPTKLRDIASPPEVAHTEAAADTHATVRSPTYPDARPSLLLVEDHPTNRQVIQIILGDLVKLHMACDGAQGLEAAQSSSYDLILMDMQMPVMDGLSATRAIRLFEQVSNRSRTPILMLSANALPEHIEASMEAGADGHVAKPVTADALLSAIDTALGSAPAPFANPTAGDAAA